MNLSDIQRVTVYLGSSGRCRQAFKDAAKRMGEMIGESGRTLVYGGMDSGLMGLVANAALASGGKVIGVIPKNLKDSERIHPNLNETILVPDLWERKLKMFRRADAVVVLPGGFGTLDELTEVLHWAALGLHRKPVVLVNMENYWNRLIDFLKPLPDFRGDYLIVTDSVEKVFAALKNWTPPQDGTDDDTVSFPHFEGMILNGSKEPLIFEETTVKQAYILSTALGLKQLDKHERAIGILNGDGRYMPLLDWIMHAQAEHFISERCTQLFSTDGTISGLKKKLDEHMHIHIDLQNEKWGPGVTPNHIELIRRNGKPPKK